MAIVAAQRSGAALRSVVIGTRITVVDEPGRALVEMARHFGNPRRKQWANFGKIRSRQLGAVADGLHHGIRKQLVCRAFAPDESALLVHADRTCIHPVIAQREQPHRQRVDHFIGDQRAAPRRCGRRIQPFRQVFQMRTMLQKRRTLAFAQVGAAFKQAITRGQRRQAFEFQQQFCRQRAAAGAEFENVAAGFAQCRCERTREAAREQESQLRRGDEIPRHPELGRAGAVVAQARRIQRQLHVTREIQCATGRRDFCTDHRGEPLAVGAFVGTGFGQFGSHAGTIRKSVKEGICPNPRTRARLP